MICAVCNDLFVEGELFFYHQRLNVYVHASCPQNDVCGEDITKHTVRWGVA